MHKINSEAPFFFFLTDVPDVERETRGGGVAGISKAPVCAAGEGMLSKITLLGFKE